MKIICKNQDKNHQRKPEKRSLRYFFITRYIQFQCNVKIHKTDKNNRKKIQVVNVPERYNAPVKK